MKRAAAAIGVLALCAVMPGSASADRCTAVKLRAIGKGEGGLLGCQARAALKGPSVERGCDKQATEKFRTIYARAGACGTPTTEVCEALADQCRDALRAALPDGGNSSPSRCEAARLAASGKKASAKLGCYAKAALAGVPVDAGCLERANRKFLAAFNRVTGCTGDNAAATIEALVDSACVDDLVTVDSTGRVTAICPIATTTTTTSTTTSTTDPACDVCSEGRALDPACSPCAATICAATQDPSCCEMAWDATCVAEACTVCGVDAAPCPGTPCAP